MSSAASGKPPPGNLRLKSASAWMSTAAGISFRRGGIDVVRVETKLIVNFAFLGVAENVVRFRDRLEFFFGRLVPGIYVRMVLARKLAERLANLIG